MEELLKSVYAQLGAVGLLTISGWLMFWLERKQHLTTQQRRDDLLERLLVFMQEQKEIIEKISEGLAVQELIREEFTKYRELRDRNN